MNIAKHSLIKVTKSLILRNAAESNLVIRHSTAAIRDNNLELREIF